ncbi:MAG: C40 family peptidase [bacterium]
MKFKETWKLFAFLLFFVLSAAAAHAESYRVGPAGLVPDVVGSSFSVEGLPSEVSSAKEADLAPLRPVNFKFAGGNTASVKSGKACLPGSVGHKKTSLASRHGNLMTRLVRHSMDYIGVPYVWAGTSSYGFDCSGFVWKMFSTFGISLPRMADSQYLQGSPVSSSEIKPGDLVFFSTYSSGVSHVGISVGNNKFIHSSSSRGVTVSDLSDPYYRLRYVGARRL